MVRSVSFSSHFERYSVSHGDKNKSDLLFRTLLLIYLKGEGSAMKRRVQCEKSEKTHCFSIAQLEYMGGT